MREFLRNLSFCFAAGAFGGLCYAIGLWAMGHYGFIQWLGVDLGTPRPSGYYLYQRVVWGGICGLIFLLPWRPSWLTRGFFLSLIPAGVLLLLVLPPRYGFAALNLGALTPLVIVLACAIGGIAASGLLRAQGK